MKTAATLTKIFAIFCCVDQPFFRENAFKDISRNVYDITWTSTMQSGLKWNDMNYQKD